MSATLQQRADQDAKVIARLRRERDKLCHTVKRLRSEHGVAYGERDLAVREHNEAQQRISSL